MTRVSDHDELEQATEALRRLHGTGDETRADAVLRTYLATIGCAVQPPGYLATFLMNPAAKHLAVEVIDEVLFACCA